MSLLAARRRKERSDSGEYSDASYENPNNINSDNDGEGDSEYGSAEHSGSDLSERESGDGQECEKRVDDDEDRRNPQYIPKRGTFYEHDDRTASGGDNETTGGPPSDGTAPNDVSRSDRNSTGGSEGGVVGPGDSVGGFPPATADRKKVSRASTDKWTHDKYNENDQAPKSSEELMSVYGYDIRGEEGPPRAFRRRKYGRGPNKYTRNWADEEAYGRGVPGAGGVGPRTPKGPPTVTNGEEFPALQSKNERNIRMDKRRSNGNDNTTNRRNKEEIADEPKESSPTKQIFPDKAAFSPKPKPEKFVTERPEGDKDAPGRKLKGSGPTRMEPRRTIITVRNQTPLQEQNKREVITRSISPQRPLPPAISKQSPVALAAAFPALPPQDKKILPPRKVNQSQIPPRMQNIAPTSTAVPSTPSLPAAVTVSATASPAGPNPSSATAATPQEAGARGKRYSSLRQRPMPDAYQPQAQQTQQQAYINEYQQQPLSVQKPQSIPQQQQSPLSNLTSVPLRQTPPPLIAQQQQQQQQTPLPQQQQQSQQQQQQNIQQTQQQNIHQQMQQAQQLQQQLQMQQQLHQQQQQQQQQQAVAQPAATVLQHQQAQNVNLLHQQGVGVGIVSGLPRQQAKGGLPLRQVSRPLQQPLPLHTMPATAHMQGGLVATQSYAQPPMMPPGQYIQSSNGAVYGQVYAQQPYPTLPPQAMPPPQALPQTMPPQAMPQQIPQQMPQQIPQQMPQQLTQQIPQQMPQQLTQQMPQQIPQQLTQQLPQQLSQQLPQQLSQQMPQQLPQQLAQQMPQQLPQQLAQQMPQQLPQQLAQQMPQMPPQVMPQQALPIAPQAMSSQAMTAQSMPSQVLPPQAMQGQGYHHQSPAPPHQAPYPPHVNTGRTVFREPSGITYYSPQEQKGAPPPLKRPTSAIPIVPPPSRGRGRIQDAAAAAQKDNIDHIVDNMFVPRHQSRTGPSRPGDTPPRTIGVDPQVMKQYEEPLRQYDERPNKEYSPPSVKESSPPLGKDSSPPLARELTPPPMKESIPVSIIDSTAPLMKENVLPKEVPSLVSEGMTTIVTESVPSLAQSSPIEPIIEDRVEIHIESVANSQFIDQSESVVSNEVDECIKSDISKESSVIESNPVLEEMDLEVVESLAKEVEDKLMVESNSSLKEIETEPAVIEKITDPVEIPEVAVQENSEGSQKVEDECDPPLEEVEEISTLNEDPLPEAIVDSKVETVTPQVDTVDSKEGELEEVEEKSTVTDVKEVLTIAANDDTPADVKEQIDTVDCDVAKLTELVIPSEVETEKVIPEVKSLAEELLISESSQPDVETKSEVDSKEIIETKPESPDQRVEAIKAAETN